MLIKYLHDHICVNSQKEEEAHMGETSMDVVTRDLDKGKILCDLDMKLEIDLFIQGLAGNLTTKDTSKSSLSFWIRSDYGFLCLQHETHYRISNFWLKS